MPPPSSADQPHPLSTFCGRCAATGRCRIGLETEYLDATGEAHFELACPPEDEAQNGVAHGGWTASALDEALGRVLSLRGHMAVVGQLTLSFDRPVPVGHPLVARSWVESREARKWHVAGELTLRSSGAVLARASGVFVLRDRDAHYSEFEDWLGQQQRHS